jgi:anti-sigma factor RsiW
MKNVPDKNDLEYRISLYLDGLLEPSEAAEIESLAERDSAVAAELRRYRRLQGHLEEFSRRTTGAIDFDAQRANIRAELERRELLRDHRKPAMVLRLRPAYAALAVAALLLVVASAAWLAFEKTSSSSRPEAPVALGPEPTVSVEVLPAVEPEGRSSFHVEYPQVKVSASARGPKSQGTVAATIGSSTLPGKPGAASEYLMDIGL